MSDSDDELYNESVVGTSAGMGKVKSKYILVDDVVKQINDMLQKIKSSGVDAEDKEGNAELLKTLRDEYKDFATSHPVVIRWMVEARQYDERAFRAYARNHVKASYKDRSEFWKCQAEYLVLLFKRLNPRVGLDRVRAYRESVTASLKKDDKEFNDAKEEAEEEIKKIKARATAARKDRLIAYLNAMRNSSAVPPP